MDEHNHKKNKQQNKLADSFMMGKPSAGKTPAAKEYTLPKTKRYTLQEELGRGGMGVVYKAYDNILQQTVAVKIIQQCDSRQIQRFLNECKAMAHLDHPNIIKFFEFGVEPKPYFTMEYIGGKTLKDAIRDKKFGYVFLINLMIQICEALAYAHKHNIIHRDIKPENIMITTESKVKIMDFGLAKMFDVDQESLSKTGDIVGSIHYMSPEQIRGEACSQSDIYAVGAILYECLTYKKVFRGDSQVDIMYQICEKTPVPPRKLNSSISPYLEAICLKCIEKNVSKRYKDFRELLWEFRNLKSNKPILAKKYSWQRRTVNFLKSHSRIFVAAIFCIMLFTILWLLQTEKYEREQKSISSKNDNTPNKISNTLRDQKKAEQHFFKGKLYQKKKMFKEAIAEYSQAIDLGRKGWEICNLRGQVYAQQMQHEEAVRDYSKSIEFVEDALQRPELKNRKRRMFKKNLFKILLSRAKAYIKLEKLKLALADLKRCVEFAPNDPDVHYLEGTVRRSLRQFGHAIDSYEKAIACGYVNKKKLQREIRTCEKRLRSKKK